MRLSKWQAYWAGLATILFAICFWRNARKYRDRTRFWWTGKAAVDTAIVVLLAIFCPPLLIAYCVLWLLQFVSNKPIWKTTFSILAGISLSAIGGWFLELILIIGVFAIDLVSGKFLHHWRATAK